MHPQHLIAYLSIALLAPADALSSQLNWTTRSSPQPSAANWTQNQAWNSALLWNRSTPTESGASSSSWRKVNAPEQLSDTASADPAAPPNPSPALKANPKPTPTGPVVMALSRSITVDRSFYPDVSLTVPNGFKRDPQRFLTLSVEGTNQVRRRTFKSCRDSSSSCSDFEFNAELALLQSGPASLELLYNVGDVFPDSNNQGWGAQALGFRAAVNLTSTFGIAIGGESQLNFDNKLSAVDTDGGQLKGRTLYAVASVALPMSKAAKPPILTMSAGAGNGYYGFNGTGASDSQWGPFGSISYTFNEYIALGVEYSGYAISGGLSVKPFKGVPLTGSLYVTDFLGNFPSYLENFCYNGECSARVLGRLTYSF
jgi:hypothetical protein